MSCSDPLGLDTVESSSWLCDLDCGHFLYQSPLLFPQSHNCWPNLSVLSLALIHQFWWVFLMKCILEVDWNLSWSMLSRYIVFLEPQFVWFSRNTSWYVVSIIFCVRGLLFRLSGWICWTSFGVPVVFTSFLVFALAEQFIWDPWMLLELFISGLELELIAVVPSGISETFLTMKQSLSIPIKKVVSHDKTLGVSSESITSAWIL